jgi:putative restriction endonuclease
MVLKLLPKCPITGIDNPELLRASHIKPWRVSSNEERLNTDNGLLLTPNYDHLFDKGLMTFSDDGKLIMSSGIDAKQARLLGIDDKAEIKGFSPKAIPFLRYHREYVFRKDRL